MGGRGIKGETFEGGELTTSGHVSPGGLELMHGVGSVDSDAAVWSSNSSRGWAFLIPTTKTKC